MWTKTAATVDGAKGQEWVGGLCAVPVNQDANGIRRRLLSPFHRGYAAYCMSLPYGNLCGRHLYIWWWWWWWEERHRSNSNVCIPAQQHSEAVSNRNRIVNQSLAMPQGCTVEKAKKKNIAIIWWKRRNKTLLIFFFFVNLTILYRNNYREAIT